MSELPDSLEQWVQTLPDFVQEVVREKPPITCYRSTENDGHYWLEGITEINEAITYTILHGTDSFLPGFRVYHINPNTLIPCRCGKWVTPTEEQIESAQKVSEAMLHVISRQHPDEFEV